MSRRHDVLGNERPQSLTGSRIMALPDSIPLTPINFPKIHCDVDSPVKDIYDPNHSKSNLEIAVFVKSPQKHTLPTDSVPFRLICLRDDCPLDVSDFDATYDRQPTRLQKRTSKHTLDPEVLNDAYQARSYNPQLSNRETGYLETNDSRRVSDERTVIEAAGPTLLVRPTSGKDDTIASSPDAQSITNSIRSINRRALYANQSLSYQRFIFTLAKFPALVMVFVSLWVLWGLRVQGMNIPAAEKNAAYAGFATGLFVLTCTIFLLHQHYNSYKKAKFMSYMYHLTMLGAFCGAITSLVFAATTFSKLKIENANPLQQCTFSSSPFNYTCTTVTDRINYQAVLLGANAFLVMLSLMVFIFGTVGQSLMSKRLAEEYQRISSSRAYVNHGMY